MDKLIAVFVLILVIGIIVIGEIYFKLDRNRTLALTLLKRMDFTNWLETAGAMFNACSAKWADAYSLCKNQYDSIENRHIYKKVTVLNEIRALAKKAIAENIDNSAACAFAKQLTDDFMVFANLQLDYNSYVYSLNHAMEGKLSHGVGKLFRIRPLDKLADLTVL